MFSRVINTNDPPQFYHNLAQNWTGGSNCNKSIFNVYNTNEPSPSSLNQFSINLFQNWAECAKKIYPHKQTNLWHSVQEKYPQVKSLYR